MRILALDASSHACSAALIEDGRVVAHRLNLQERGQAEALIPLVAEVLAEAGLACSDADMIAASVGPGSFTGLRIGLAAARGLCLATGKPFAGISSFEALARAAPEAERLGRIVLACVDAKRAEIFVQCLDESLNALNEPQALLAEEVPSHLPQGPLLVAGDGAATLKDILSQRPDALFSSAPPHLDAVWVGMAAFERLAEGRPVLPPAPLYLRAPDVTISKKQ
ncbi:MAG: tRNA (adenosine(37)-N6)-threonylcarbamoyltransferase complex dimerization subunit type 1 TsaB [Alphaproteobacteria bacterium]|nr:tRNA (adenosine(37)-N6)-threonylcarbamoyltransferase complex dimerization subunit type 1 TsaB [Alphaproteobacteria bacterium]